MSPPDKGSAGKVQSAPARAKPAAKRPWVVPHVRTGHLFESNSLACGKNSAQLEQCLQNPLVS